MSLKRKIILYISTFAVLIFVGWFFHHYREKLSQIIVPFILALIISYLIYPIVLRLERRKISRMVGILLIYFVFVLLLAGATIFVVPEIINNTKDLMNTLPDITNRYQGMFSGLMSSIQSSKWPVDMKNAMFVEIQNGAAQAQRFVTGILKKSLITLAESITTFFDLILAMIIAYYFIKDAEIFRRSILFLVPKRWRNGIINTGRDVNAILSNFIQGQLITAFIVGVMESIGLVIVRVKYPIVLGMVGGLANIIPYFGPFIGAIPAVAVALIQSPTKAIWAAVVFTVVQQIDNSFISPKIIEGRLGLHPVTTILAVLVGGEFFGITGMLVAVPITAILKAIAKRVVEAIV